MKGLRVLGYSCGSNVVRRGSKRDTGDMYDINSCTFPSSGIPVGKALIGRSFKGSAGNKFRLASKKTAALTVAFFAPSISYRAGRDSFSSPSSSSLAFSSSCLALSRPETPTALLFISISLDRLVLNTVERGAHTLA